MLWEGQIRPFPNERLQWFDLNSCNDSFQTETAQPFAAVSCQPLRSFGSDPDGEAGTIRCNPYRETQFKKNRTG